jgi:hypothetical protein
VLTQNVVKLQICESPFFDDFDSTLGLMACDLETYSVPFSCYRITVVWTNYALCKTCGEHAKAEDKFKESFILGDLSLLHMHTRTHTHTHTHTHTASSATNSDPPCNS